MDAATREFVRKRAGNRCEYCQLPQDAAPFFTFHIEHVRARQHPGGDEVENLAVACPTAIGLRGQTCRVSIQRPTPSRRYSTPERSPGKNILSL